MFVPIAKMAVRQTISLLVARETKDFVVEHTEVDPDSIPLQIGSMCVGEIVATKAKPYTDEAVDNVAAWINKKRNRSTADEETSTS